MIQVADVFSGPRQPLRISVLLWRASIRVSSVADQRLGILAGAGSPTDLLSLAWVFMAATAILGMR